MINIIIKLFILILINIASMNYKKNRCLGIYLF